MTEMEEAIKAFLEESNFTYEYKEEPQCFDLGLTVDNGTVHARLLAREEEAFFMAYAVWDGRVPVRSLPLLLPIINEINNNTKFTTVAVDPKDGEISCHCGINTDESTLSPRQVGVSLQLAVRTLDDNIERIMRAAWHSPANADGLLN